MARTEHKDIEFHVGDGSDSLITKNLAEACAAAVGRALARGESNIDVVIGSKAGARAWEGDEGVEKYEEDPEASVFDRLVIKAHSEGRVP